MKASAKRGRALIGSGVVLALAICAANGMNAVFQLALARILDPPDYALLAALLAVVFVGAVPPLAFQATVAREVAARLAAGDEAGAGSVLTGTVRGALAWMGALLVLAGIAVPVAAAAGLDQRLALFATAATVAASLVLPVVWGGLQGSARFVELSAAQLCLAGTRLAAGLAIALAGGSVGAVMLGVFAATLVTAVVTALPARSLLRSAVRAKRRRLVTRSNVASALGLTALWGLAFSDLIAARLAFAGGEAGDYAAASVGARVLLLVPVAVTTVLFPHVATLADPVRERRHLGAGLLVVAAVAAPSTALLWSLSGPLLELAFGSKYADAEAWLGPLSLAMALYALATVYLYHFLSLGRARFSLVLVALFCAQIVVYGLFHDAPRDVIGVQLTFAAAALVAGEIWYLLRHR